VYEVVNNQFLDPRREAEDKKNKINPAKILKMVYTLSIHTYKECGMAYNRGDSEQGDQSIGSGYDFDKSVQERIELTAEITALSADEGVRRFIDACIAKARADTAKSLHESTAKLHFSGEYEKLWVEQYKEQVLAENSEHYPASQRQSDSEYYAKLQALQAKFRKEDQELIEHSSSLLGQNRGPGKG